MKACILGIQKILKGGTALMFGYGLDRFSEDLDFDIAHYFVGKNTIKLDGVLKKSIPSGVELISLNLKKDTKAVTCYILNYRERQTGLTGCIKNDE
ncbi:MAG: nucleotidyl transferase AbiEii/AbiGii toxin family protein [Campylobacteraceae bacterium]|jgi:predicted nucleotidyltransferase component of viral defense system|nr:nucleotidyl transferase AbiEii/AbiGii toxin family protein [Campylobacteraceae bacterium]